MKDGTFIQKQWLNKDSKLIMMAPVKSIKHTITIFGIQMKVIYIKNVTKIRDIELYFYVIYSLKNI